MKVQVLLQVELHVNYGDSPYLSREELLEYMLEENNCPGTGPVGAEIERRIEESNELGICWACPIGETKILEVDGVPYVRRRH